MLKEIIEIFWFLLPAGIANIAPVLVKNISILNYPVDFNKKIIGKPILGKNKTYRGLIFGIIFAIIFVYVQKLFYPYLIDYSLVDYNSINIFLLGFLLGFGALFGDLIESFFKRRVGFNPGKNWIVFDQIDWVVFAILFVYFYVNLSLLQIIYALIVFGILHVIVNYVGYFIGVKENKF